MVLSLYSHCFGALVVDSPRELSVGGFVGGLRFIGVCWLYRYMSLLNIFGRVKRRYRSSTMCVCGHQLKDHDWYLSLTLDVEGNDVPEPCLECGCPDFRGSRK